MFRVWIDATSLKAIVKKLYGIHCTSTAILDEVRAEFCEQLENELDSLLLVQPKEILRIVLEETFYLLPRIPANAGCVQKRDDKAPPVVSERTT